MSELREEIAARLAAEHEPMNTAPEEPIEGDPEGEVVGDDGTNVEDDQLLQPEQSDEDDAGEEAEGELDPKYAELEKKYRSLEAEFSRVTANRKQVEENLEQATVAATQRQHELEETFGTATQYAEYYAGLASQQVAQIQQQLNQPNLTPEQFQKLYQQMNQAQAMAGQFQQGLKQVQEQRKSAEQAQKRREAELTMARIKTRYPDFDSRRGDLFNLAQEIGFTQEEASSITDFRMVSLLNEVYESRKARSAVKEPVTKRKPQPPGSRSGDLPRNEKGQFAKAKREFYDSRPGVKGSFAAMKAAQLEAERLGKT